MTKPHHILIVEARFYEDIADNLAQGAEAELKKAGVTWERVPVPGCLELPGAILFAERSGRFDAYVALGCVIRGETSHYDYVCSESMRGLHDLVLSHGIALGNGVLTCEDDDQAIVRADPQKMNKGGAAALAALEMLQMKRRFA